MRARVGVAAALCVALSAGAQEAAHPPAAKEAAVPASPAVLSRELAALTMPKDVYEKMITGMLAGMGQALQSAQFTPDMQDQLRHELLRIYSYDEMVALQSSLLEKHYTGNELKRLIFFYKTPLGRKTVQKMPEITQEVMASQQQKMMRDLPATMQRILASGRGADQAGQGGSPGVEHPKAPQKPAGSAPSGAPKKAPAAGTGGK